jgi:hypothetical protein
MSDLNISGGTDIQEKKIGGRLAELMIYLKFWL